MSPPARDELAWHVLFAVLEIAYFIYIIFFS